MKAKKILCSIGISIFILYNISACNSIPPTIQSEAKSSEIPVKATPTIALSPTPISSIIPTPAITQAFTPSPNPTLENDQKMILVEDLLTNNKNCKLPCWWGFIPGKTKWQAAKSFLETFSKDIYSFKTSETNFLHRVIIPVPEKIFPQDLWNIYNERSGIIENIEIFPGQTTVYNLPNVLNDYGQPNEVWLSWINTKPNEKGYFPIFVILYYRSQGIIVEYSPNNLTVTKSTVIECPQKEMFPEMFLWSPELEIGKNFDDILNQTELYGKGLHYLSLEKATGISVEKFYSTFKNVDNSTCIETRFDLWTKGKDPFQ